MGVPYPHLPIDQFLKDTAILLMPQVETEAQRGAGGWPRSPSLGLLASALTLHALPPALWRQQQAEAKIEQTRGPPRPPLSSGVPRKFSAQISDGCPSVWPRHLPVTLPLTLLLPRDAVPLGWQWEVGAQHVPFLSLPGASLLSWKNRMGCRLGT